MKTIKIFALLLLVLCSLQSQAKNFYLSSLSGDDSNDGLTPESAWQTIDKLNASFTAVDPGDSILFKCGEIFNGSIVFGKAGLSSRPIVVSSYGAGAKPVISGFTTLTGWTNLNGNIWQCDAPLLKNTENILTINGTPYAVGRTPNNSFFTYQSASTTQLTSSTLTGTPSYVGAEIVMRKTAYRAEKATITAQSGSTVTYIQTLPIDNNLALSPTKGTANYGFFLQRYPGSLDQFGEWYFDTTAKKMQVYSTGDPSAYLIKASYVDTVILLNNKTNIVVANLAVEGGGMYGVESYTGIDVTIRNCSFNNNTKSVYMWNTSDATVDGNTINNSFNGAILVSNNQSKRINVTNNYITNTGQLIGMGLFWGDYNLKGIIARTDSTTAFNYVNVTGNVVKNTGHAGIQFQGSNATVRRNIVDSFTNQLDDNGGIYTFNNNTSLSTTIYRNRVVDSNFILNAIGAPLGANNSKDVAGYFMDDQSHNISGKNNTIANVPGNGVQMNNPYIQSFTNNTVYNCATAIAINKKPFSEIQNVLVRNNVFYQKDSSQYNFSHSNDNLTLPSSMTLTQSLTNLWDMDSNYISNMKYAGYAYFYSSGSGYSFPPPLTLAQWQNTYLHDLHSLLPALPLSSTNTKIEYNQGYSPKTVSFNGLSKIDPKGNVYNNSATVPRWSSLVLIDNGAATTTNLAPTADAGKSVLITLPANTATLTGSGIDSDGTVLNYAWRKLSGPSAGTMQSVNDSVVTLNNLASGVYQYELTVTDNYGATGRDQVQVTVNQAPTVNAGTDKVMHLPTNNITITAVATDADGFIGNYSWAKISGPDADIVNPNFTSNPAAITINNMVQGTYLLKFTATDNNGASTSDTVQVIVNQPPFVDAGLDKVLVWPTNSTSFAGVATDPDGTVAGYAWSKFSGPSAGTISSPNLANTNITGLAQGIYQFILTVTDNRGGKGRDTIQVTINVAPVANAGGNKLISLPVNTTTLTGNGTDADGTIATYAWTKISGPSSGTIVSPNTQNTDLTDLAAGVYLYQLTVTDNSGTTATATVQVTVNQPPTASAGPDKLISLPLTTTTLSGGGADSDGTVSSYQWIKIAGPSSGTIATPNSPVTDINNLTQGVYQYQLTATDNNGATGTATVQITVNQPPVANAGADLIITLPVNNSQLSGYGSDVDGTVSNYAWIKLSGPSSGTISNADAAVTDINNLTYGVYQFQLTITDNNGATAIATVQVIVNQPPMANAGPDQLITLPNNTINLNGSGTDPDGAVSSYSWIKLSGPSSGNIATANAPVTGVSNLVQGIYQYQLTVSDNNGATATSVVQVIVNKAPTADAGANQVITLPVNFASLTGTGSDADGTVSSYEWIKLSGPSSGNIATPHTASTTIDDLAGGVYQYQLTVTDNNGASATAVVQITVNQSPLANAGADKLISSPVNTVNLIGAGFDADGSISNYAWVKISGPTNGNITSSNAATTAVNNLTQGTYQFELTVTDNNGATGKDTVHVTVNQSPTANAGADKLISLPTNSVSLTGSGSDADGTVTSYAWAKISGPASGTIASQNSATTVVNNLVQGTYQFELTVTDNNGATGKDTVQITVNQSPTANAGTDKLISLPSNSVSLTGSGTDADGTVSSYAWAKISGPTISNIGSPNSATTTVNNLTQGIYQFELTVTDNNGATGKDTVQVTVNQSPTANAGTDKLINLPSNSVSLTGSGTDADGTVSSYAWAKISGPASSTIASPNAATTIVNNLVQGIYQFELTVTDNNGATGKGTVQVVVNQSPTANAGVDKLINLPTNNVSLTGSGIDADGTVSSYAWVKISGPASSAIASPNAATTVVNNLVQGTYQFELTITDNNGATGKDTVQVIVNQAPTANAGTDKLINLPSNSVSLTGSGTDADGTVNSYAWAKISGPTAGTFSTPALAITSVNNLVQGVYLFELTVTDNNGATGKDTVQITVNQSPTANAGTDKLISLPANSVSLTGIGTDADGTVSSYAWAKISGPATSTIASPNAATTVVNNLVQGNYQLELTVTDNNGATGKDTVQVIVNQPPSVNAGTDKIITLPINTSSLAATATDIDGTIAGYAWTKISGPATGSIVTPAAAITTLSSLVQGTYLFAIIVTDNNGATGKDTVQVIVNQAPTGNAGTDKIISLPTNSVSLTGSGTDADGTVTSYAWTKISGPASGTIASPNAATTSINNLAQGIYQFELTVTDNNGATGKDTVQVTVNQSPIANAGTDKLISLPTNSVSFTGNGTDADGTVTSYSWTKISGPASGNIASPSSATTAVNNLAQGIYQFELTVTDNNGATGKDTVQVTVNQSPIANAGTDKLISLPTNSVSLTGSGTDADGTVTSYSWAKISGPASGTIASSNSATTTVNNLVQGIYQFELTVTDNNGATGKDTVQVTVNQSPIANAGTDKLINLPTNSVSLTGNGTDADGTVTSYLWTKISGPASGNIASPSSATTAVNNLAQGIYQFELTVTDNNGATGKDTVQVTVNQSPIANAGTDKLISLPTNSVSLTGSGTDADGTVTSYSWAKISGPASGTIASSNSATTTVNNLVQGIYQFELTVTDNNGATGKDTVQVTVNQSPTANAGTDKLISLPTNAVSLIGSGADADGTVSGYAWAKISGPASGTIASPSSATTAVNNLAQGIYQFELTVTDNNGATGKDTVQVTVNQSPTANAGIDKLINLPTNTVSLIGSGTDADGTVTSYSWSKISGPASSTIISLNAATTSINNLVQGIYQFELTVTDNNGATGKDTVQVTVNQSPTANAGLDKLISLPTNTVSLTGSGIDADGTVSNYAWAKISGPASGTIASSNSATTTVNNLVQGIYQFELTVTDNNGATGKDTVQVTVNQSPTANAGTDKLISLPTNSVSLTGSGIDADGTVTSYSWAKISGPASGTIASPNSATTAVNNLVQGIYQFELTVTDNNGATGKDTVQVTVNQLPIANAGTDKLISLPTNSVSLTGSGTDADGTVTSYAWSKISGPASSTLTSLNVANTSINNLVQGIYQFELTVTDNNGATGKDTVQVTVNQSPTANAGIDKLISLPTNTISLTGSGADADGTVTSYSWAKISGLASGTIASPNAATTAVNNLAQGTYQFELTVTDNNGATGKDTVQVIVNQSPTANAGTDKLVSLPTNTVSLTGSGADADGTVSGYAWVKISGPASGTIVSPSTATTTVNNLVQGVYQFQLTVTDNNGTTGKDTVQVTVNQSPTANAGIDKLISLPTNTISLTGSGADADGTVTSYSWAKISGPASSTITSLNAATTSINNLVQGIYQFELTVIDNNGATGKDTVQVTVNQSPTANAGIDKLISLPTNTVSLIGSGTDADGTVTSYSWSKISGPASGTIASPSTATTTINNLVQGIYQFELTVTDNNGATAKDTVQVTVNQSPTANAGTDKLISLPINSVSLTGSGIDADGTVASYAWAKISGPASGTIASLNSATTTVNNLVRGIYQFELTVTDNNGATGKDTVQVTVNQSPTANAGTDKLISLPTNTVSLTGSGTDADGTVSNYAWAKISGPASGTIASPNSATTAVNNLVQGIYQFELTVMDNNGATGKDTVQVIVNQSPTANAGLDKLISLPTNTVSLNGSGIDADGTVSNYAWAKISGPANGTIASSNLATTTVNNLVQGIYQFELTVSDNNGATGKDTVQVTVNQSPIANAGTDKLISLPTNSVSLTGSGTDADGTVTSYSWAKISGPASGTIASPNAATTSINNLVQGIYQFELTVTDNNGATGKDTVQVTVNQSPTANAGIDKLISLPTNTISLTGSGADADGSVTSYAWAKISGPVSGTIASPNAATTSINNLAQGIYQFELTVTDNNGATGKDTVQVTVNQSPTANAGIDKLINLPTNTVSLIGSGADADGTVAVYSWAKISGPASGTIASPSAATTTVNSLVQGVYQFELTVTDNNGATGKDTVQVTINQSPTANGGTDKLISLPTNTVSLIGSGTDADGTVISYSWSKISGPASGTIASPSAATTTVNGLVQGIYQFELTVTDNNGATSKDTVQVTVNQSPTANAGTDKLISLPTNTVSLTGSGADADGSVTSYAWAKISGPVSGTIASPNAAITSINNLVQGIYQFELTVTDNNGATGKDTVQVTVNQSPTANAGIDKLISLPTNTISLTGSGADADGTVTSYSWAKISGPASGTIASPNAATTSLNNLVQGIYQFELTATDNNGATGKDTVQVTVNQSPTVNAGTDKIISLPINTTTLTATAADVDGTIASYAWTKISGPTTGTIATPAAASTNLTSLVQGTYQFAITVTDNNGATGKDTVQVIVNQSPSVNAGADKIISLPTNTTTLTATATDVDGTIASYAWTKISGPTTGTIATPAAASTNLTSLIQGTYQFAITVTDNNGATGKDTVQVIVNQPPSVNAGTDKVITLPTNTTTLTATATDVDGTIASYAWAKISGPTTGTIATPATATSALSSLVQGTYLFTITVTDNNGATGKDTVQVTVNPAANIVPVANAGTDKIITLPTNTTSLTGTGTDADGTISSYAWVKISGPTTGTIATPAAATTALNSLVQGTYLFQLTVTDNKGATGKDTVQVIVNQPPVVNAGTDKIITLPINTSSLTATATDADGTIASYAWVKISGPATGTIATSATATTTLNSLAQGTYLFAITVTDNRGAIGKDTVQVIVNQPPSVNAGTDKIITLPTSTSSLTATATDVDGTISSYAWVKISGPTTGTIASPAAATTALSSLVQGAYQFQVTVTDNRGATAKDTVLVTVNAAANIAPVANAGVDKIINLPTNTTSLTGTGTDADGTISTYAWAKISGPTSGTIATSTAATTVLNNLVQGTYLFTLTVTDNKGATGKDTVQVIANQLPVANAGTDKIISLPTNTTSLTGTGTDADGTISSYAWVKLSGPATGTIASANAATTALNSLVQGTYLFTLTVTDNRGATGKDTVQVIVNQPPVVNASTDKVVTLPTNTTSLTGTGTDADGTISSYAWAKLSGPTTGTIASPAAATTALNSLVQGTYLFTLTVTDNRGATGKDTVQVTVNAAGNQVPKANAGTDKVITLPTNTTTLTGSGTDADGTISGYAWAKLSGPTTGAIASPTAATTALNSLVQGTYLFTLTVTDNRGATGKDTVQVIVNAAANQIPIANAGTDKSMTLPTNSVTLTGTGTDADGTVSSYAWAKVSGPTSGTISSATSATTRVINLAQGTYKFQLTVTDNKGATAKDTVQVIVSAAASIPITKAEATEKIRKMVKNLYGHESHEMITRPEFFSFLSQVAAGKLYGTERRLFLIWNLKNRMA